jgi:esterase/lipase
MPGMAASSSIFERIHLPTETFEMHLLEWVLPNKNESLNEYAKRMAKNIKHENVILVGVSFGGILVQEMRPFVNPKKVIVISSIKSNAELSRQMKVVKSTKAYKLIPTKLFENIEFLAKFTYGTSVLKQNLRFKSHTNCSDFVSLTTCIDYYS